MVRLVLVFIHVSSTMGVFAALAIEGVFLLQLHRAADSAQLSMALHIFRVVPRVAIPSFLVAILSGMYLTATVWGWRAAWIDVAVASLIVNAVIGAATMGPRVTRLETGVTADGRRDPILWASFIMRTFILIGIVFLMTLKTPLEASLIAMTTAMLVGLVAGLPLLTRRASHDAMVSA
jgi:hypothetical protein